MNQITLNLSPLTIASLVWVLLGPYLLVCKFIIKGGADIQFRKAFVTIIIGGPILWSWIALAIYTGLVRKEHCTDEGR